MLLSQLKKIENGRVITKDASLLGYRVVITGKEHDWNVSAIVRGEEVKKAWGMNKTEAYRKAKILSEAYTDENGQSLKIDLPVNFFQAKDAENTIKYKTFIITEHSDGTCTIRKPAGSRMGGSADYPSVEAAKKAIDEGEKRIMGDTKDASLESLQRQLEQAKREGDTSWAKELEGEIENLKRENESQAKDADKLIFGHTWAEIQAMQKGTYKAPTIKTTPGKDYGCDPIGNGMYKMVPSGDIVNEQERNKRLGRAKDSSCQIKDIAYGGKGYKCMKCGATDVMPGLIKHKAKDGKTYIVHLWEDEYEIEIIDSTHAKMRLKGTERWGTPLHFAQIRSEVISDLKKQGAIEDRGRFFKDEKSVKDSDPIDITISLSDPDGSLIAFLKGLARTANPGHSFEVIMDPDGGDGPQKFGFDGDGAFRIHSINGSEDFKTEDAEGLKEEYSNGSWKIMRREVPEENIQEFIVYKNGTRMGVFESYSRARRFTEGTSAA
jgi:hypothetical protein